MTGQVVWFTGLPASGKSTLARKTESALRDRGAACCVLDSDDVRRLLHPPPGYSEEERDNFYGFLGRLAAHLAGHGLTVLVPATAHRRRWREAARALSPRFLEVYVDATADECRQRDDKGLYRRADRGEIDSLPGVGVELEAPEHPDVVARSGRDDDALDRLLALIQAQLPGR